MAKLPQETLTTIFNLQRQFVEMIDQATAAESTLLEYFGETQETIPELDQLQNVKQRLSDPYSRLSTLLLRIAESQPMAPVAMLQLLSQTIEQGQAALDAAIASVQETKRNWNLP